MSHDHSLDRDIRQYWEAGGEDVEKARRVLSQAIAHPPRKIEILARAVTVAQRAQAVGFADAVNSKLIEPLATARSMTALLDVLGDQDVEPAAAIFDHLAQHVGEDLLLGADLRSLEGARAGASSRPAAAAALLDALGWDRLGDIGPDLRGLVDALEQSATEFSARVLVISPDRAAGLCLGLNVLEGDRPGIYGIDAVDLEMDKQAATVLSAFEADHPAIKWSLEWPLRYAGESIGLALRVAALVAFNRLRPDPLLAATGAVSADGRVRHVEGIAAKLVAARDAGMRRVLLPRENEEEATAAGVEDDVQLLFVDHIDDIPKRLSETAAANEMTFDGRIRMGRSALPLYGLSVQDERPQPYSWQLIVTDAAGRAILQLWTSGKVLAAGPPGPTRERVKQLIADVFDGDAPQEREGHRFMLAEDWRQSRLRDGLETAGAQEKEIKGSGELMRYALRRKSSTAQVTLWTSGKGHLTGSAPAFDEILAIIAGASEGLANVDSVAKPKSRGPAGGNTPAELPSEGPWIGTDESGKGDYFGPLVSAAVFVDDDVAERLTAAGVTDSKKLTDKRVLALAPTVRELAGAGCCKVTPINPARYNELYQQFKAEGQNLNALLAWGHTRSIEDLLGAGLKPRYAIVDQFADASYIKKRLLAEARDSGLEVFQFPKAEANVAVAAASILAREAFLLWLQRASTAVGETLPKGASPQVEEVARRVVKAGGRSALAEVAKLHFKTTDKVLG